MGQHGRNRTGSDKTRGDRAFDTERHDVALGEDERVDGFAPAIAAPWDVQHRPLPGIEVVGPQPLAGAPDPSPRMGFDGVDRRRKQQDGWEERDRRHAPYTYGPPLT